MQVKGIKLNYNLQNQQEKKAIQKSQEFEEILLSTMLKPIFEDNLKEEESFSSQMYEKLFIEQVSKAISKTGTMNIAKQVYKELISKGI